MRQSHAILLIFHVFIALALALVGAGKSAAQAGQPQNTSKQKEAGWRELAPGLEYRAITVPDSDYAKIHQTRCRLSDYKVDLAVSSGIKLNSVRAIREQYGAICAVNAGFFDENGDMLGFQRSSLKTFSSSISPSSVFTGVFFVGGGSASICHRDDFYPPHAAVAIQAGPRLIDRGEAVYGVKGKPARLSGIAVDREGRVIIWGSDLTALLTLKQMQDILLGPAEKGGIDPEYAMNLDGGSSSGFSLKFGDLSIERPALAQVPSAIIIKSR